MFKFLNNSWIEEKLDWKGHKNNLHFLKDKNIENGYFGTISSSNLKYTILLSGIIFILTLYGSIMDYITYYSSKNNFSISIYRIIDPIYAAFALIIFLTGRYVITLNNYKVSEIVNYIFISGSIINYALVSSIEQYDFNHHPSFIYSILLLSIIYVIKPKYLIMLYILGLVIIATFSKLINFPSGDVNISFSATIFIGPISFLMSWINYSNKLKNYTDSIRLKFLNKQLEEQVKERTKELTVSNQELRVQIENHSKFEQKLKTAVEKAEQSDRLKSAFLSNLSHEIRTPLNSIIGFSSLLNNSNLGAEKISRYTGLISSCGKELVFIIDQLVEVSRIESGEIGINKMYFHVNEMIYELQEESLERLRELNKDKINLNIKNTCHERNLRIYSDMMKIKHIIQNLIENAIKFTDQGEIEIGIEMDGNDQLTFHVLDTGIGISTKDKEILFQQFRQGETGMSRKYGGLGLGLSISKTYAELLGGKLWFESEEGEGTVFYFRIPI